MSTGTCAGWWRLRNCRSIAPDPDDDWVIATAIAAQADLIVTGDKPLLGVGSVGAIRIVGVAEALDLLQADRTARS